MKFLFVIDPLETLQIDHDSTVDMMKEAEKRGHEVFTGHPSHLFSDQDKGLSLCKTASFKTPPYSEGNLKPHQLEEFDGIFLRKDPPFDMNYVFSTYLLDREVSKTRVFNDPRAIRDYNEKTAILHFPTIIPKTTVAASKKVLNDFIDKNGDTVVKPLEGFAGNGVFLIAQNCPNRNVTLDMLTRKHTRPIMAQEFIPEIKTTGDRRIIVIDGQAVGAIARIPSTADHRGNMAAGARVEASELRPRDKEIVETLAPQFKARGIILAGIDVIGDYLTEINITSPTGFQEVKKLQNVNCSEKLFEAVERECQS